MNKADEILILDRAIADLGGDSYLGPWLKNTRDFVVSQVQSDLYPEISLESAVVACQSIRESAKLKAELIIEQAKREAEIITKAAQDKRESIFNRLYQLTRDIERELQR